MSPVNPLIRHPKLLLHLHEGRTAITKTHAEIEVEKVRRIYVRQREKCLSRLMSSADKELCYDYKNAAIYSAVRLMSPNAVVETGIAAGVSSFAILQGLEDNNRGVLYSIDLPNVTIRLEAGQEAGFLVPSRLRHRWNVTIGDSRVVLPAILEKLHSIDIFHHDSLHTYNHMLFECESAWPHIRSGGLLIIDDVQENDAFRTFCEHHDVKGITTERKERGYTITVGIVAKP